MCRWKQEKGVGWLIRKDSGWTVVVDTPESLYDYVWEWVDQETAIDVDGWAELASVGEVYEIRDLVIEVVEV